MVFYRLNVVKTILRFAASDPIRTIWKILNQSTWSKVTDHNLVALIITVLIV